MILGGSILDPRELADAWEDQLERVGGDPDGDLSERLAADEISAPFRAICDQLGVEESPDGLRGWDDPLVPERDFVDYARELAEDVGALDPAPHWPFTCIDWQWAARDLQMDYTSVEFDGVTYYTRGY